MEQLIEKILEKLKIPFDLEEYQGNANTYIVYSVLDNEEGDFTDDKNNKEVFSIAIHYWTNNLHELGAWEYIRDTFKSNGFEYKGFSRGSDEGFKGKLMKFEYTKHL